MARISSFVLGVIAAASMLVASPAWAQRPVVDTPGGPPANDCPVLSVSAVGAVGVGASRTFSARDVTDLSVQLIFRSEPEPGRVFTLKVLSPSGFLYRAIDVPVAPVEGKRPTGSMRLDGYPYPVPIRGAARSTAAGVEVWVADVAFPVAGTTIVTSGLYGTWRIEAWSEGALRACPGTVTFRLTE